MMTDPAGPASDLTVGTREERSKTFDEVAELYDRHRPRLRPAGGRALSGPRRSGRHLRQSPAATRRTARRLSAPCARAVDGATRAAPRGSDGCDRLVRDRPHGSLRVAGQLFRGRVPGPDLDLFRPSPA